LGAPLVAVVNRTFARRFLGEGDPVGREFVTQEPRSTIRYVVVGLVEDAAYSSLRAEMAPTLYIPIAQWDRPSPFVAIGVRTERGAPTNLVRGVADALGRTDPRAVFSFRSLSDQVAGTLTQERLVANLSTFFGALALLLAALGLYGVTSYAVNQRRAEIGIRMALGAGGPDVLRLVLGRVALLVAIGVAAGAAMSLWASRYVATLLYGLEPRDPTTFIAAAVVLAGVGLLAGGLPAWRATRIDPTTVLREG
jgi:putative ABC transport system permease protein